MIIMTMNDCYADLQWKRVNEAERKTKCTAWTEKEPLGLIL